MALSYVDHTVTDASDLTYLFTGEYIDQDHIRVFISEAGETTGFVEVEDADFTLSGTETNLTVTLGGSWASGGLELGDIVRIRRITPDSALVDFQPGTLTSASLDLAVKQIRFLVVEAREFPGVDVVIDPGIGGEVIQTGYKGDQNRWDCSTKRLSNVAAADEWEDAINLGQATTLLNQAIGGGSGTVINPGTDNQMLYALSGEWAYGAPATIRSVLGLGDVATRTVGVASASDIPARSDADARYLQASEALQEIQTAGTEATARTNLGLGTAAVLNTGTSTGDIVMMDTGDELPAVKGTQLDITDNASIKGNIKAGRVVDTATNSTDNAVALMDNTEETSFNSAETFNYATGSGTAQTIQTGSATGYYEIRYDGDLKADYDSGNGSAILKIQTTTTMSGASGWTDLYSYTARTSTGDPGTTSVSFCQVLSGQRLVRACWGTVSGGVDASCDLSVSVRKLA